MSFLPSFYTVRVLGAPLPAAYLSALKSIEVETSLNEASIFRLTFEMSRTALGDWDVLQAGIFRPNTPVQIKIALGKVTGEALINGYVNESNVNLSSQPGASTLEVVGMDITATLMNQEEVSASWPNMPDFAIASGIFAKYGIAPLATPTAGTRLSVNTTTTQRATDISFLKELAERNTYECYVRPDPILGLDTGYFGPPQLTVPPQGILSADFGVLTNLSGFSVRYDMLQPTTAATTTIDPATKAALPALAPASVEGPMGAEPTLTRVIPPPVVRPTATNFANAAEAMLATQAIASQSSRAITGTGQVDGLKFSKVLKAGLPVLVRGIGREHSGKYYVTNVTHRITTEEYTQSFQGWTNAVGLTGTEVFVDLEAAAG